MVGRIAALLHELSIAVAAPGAYGPQPACRCGRQFGQQVQRRGAEIATDGDAPGLYAAAERARTELGWVPRYTDIRDVIETAWRWAQEPRY